NRYYAQIANIPLFEPSSPQEAKDMTRVGLELSEQLELPVLLRTTTRVNHVSGPVEFGPKAPQRGKGHFEKDSSRFVVMPAVARVRHVLLLKTMEKARKMAEESVFNFRDGKKDAQIGIITSGVGYNYAKDLAEDEGLDVEFLKLGFTHPFPTKLVLGFIKEKKKIVIVEELEPYLENETRALAQREGVAIEIRGKGTGDFPYNFEYDPDVLRTSLSSILGKDMCLKGLDIPEVPLPARPPTLCAGCPHRPTFFAMNRAFKGKDVIHSTDIGCYTLGIQAPHHTADFLLCMGSSIGAAGGFSKATDQFPVAILGDSTFFHAGLSGLVNAVYNQDDLIYTIVDNRTTAMTGHQPNPGMGVDGRGDPAPMIPIAGICEACGATSVRVVDPYDIKATVEAFKEAKDEKGVRVIVPKRECALIVVKELKAQGVSEIDQEKCKKCYVCINQFACPAFYKKGDEVHINPNMCAGCHVCIQVCPFDAIHVKGGGKE
ncbi:MAG: 4Fe-4S binding protein, partial [Thermoplasmata archaeon]|nr:4Fe-4S binding protein [Thermoplasmata archaeon]